MSLIQSTTPGQKKKKRRRKKKQTPKQTQQNDNENLICPLANNKDSNSQDSISWEIHMPAKEGDIHFKIDTGADVTVIPEEDLQKLGLNKKNIPARNYSGQANKG